MIFLIDRSYIRPLSTTSAGHVMVLIGLASMTMGAIVCPQDRQLQVLRP